MFTARGMKVIMWREMRKHLGLLSLLEESCVWLVISHLKIENLKNNRAKNRR